MIVTRIASVLLLAMIAAVGAAKLMRGETDDITVNADPNLRLAVIRK